ncbi:alpha/beta fold hydrolase [Spirochaeta dissipatitropha]
MTAVYIIAAAIVLCLVYIFCAGSGLSRDDKAIIDEVLESELPELITGTTGYAESDSVKIWYELIRSDVPVRGTVCLLMSMAGDSFLWPPSFIGAFTDSGFQVLRFDYRGTGMSDWMKDWSKKNAYSLGDMARDTISVLDAAGISEAHVFGMSLGGMLAQELAIGFPDRIKSLTLMMTSANPMDAELPGPSSLYLFKSMFKGLPFLRYRIIGGEKNLIKERIANMLMAVGREHFDIRETAEQVLYDIRKRKGINMKAVFQHQKAVVLSGSRYSRLEKLEMPVLIIHGTEDRMLPYEHGQKLHELLPGSRLLTLEGVGHVIPVPGMETMMQQVIEHLAAE